MGFLCVPGKRAQNLQVLHKKKKKKTKKQIVSYSEHIILSRFDFILHMCLFHI